MKTIDQSRAFSKMASAYELSRIRKKRKNKSGREREAPADIKQRLIRNESLIAAARGGQPRTGAQRSISGPINLSGRIPIRFLWVTQCALTAEESPPPKSKRKNRKGKKRNRIIIRADRVPHGDAVIQP